MKKIGLVGNQSPLPLIDLLPSRLVTRSSWESVTSPFDRLNEKYAYASVKLGISHLSL